MGGVQRKSEFDVEQVDRVVSEASGPCQDGGVRMGSLIGLGRCLSC